MAILNFDTNSIGLADNNIFGLPTNEENARLILLPIPWEVTVSYRNGTARGPEKIKEASYQIDLCDPDARHAWEAGYFMPELDKGIIKKNDFLRHCAELIISNLSEGGNTEDNTQLHDKLEQINQGCRELNQWIYEQAKAYYAKGKMVALVGGDHSTPFGLIKAAGEQFGSFGILQIDAHADLRPSYEGFTYSHASIMYNVLQEVPQVEKLVQVGVRDFCDQEYELICSDKRIHTFFDKDLKEKQYDGSTWRALCDEIIAELPQQVYISFDIDGLEPSLCPNTGTPVPGGLSYEAVEFLFDQLVESGRQIIGFDLVEMTPGDDEWDANVGARVLYQLFGYATQSRQK